MSEMLLAFALVATFSAVMLGGLAFDVSTLDRRREVRLLESRLEGVNPNLRDQELEGSLLSRVIRPTLDAVARLALRFTPLGMRQRLAHKLVLAGSPAGWDAEKLAALKVMGLAGGTAFALLLGLGSGKPGLAITMTLLFGGIGYFACDAVLGGRAQRRQAEIQKALPDTMDLLTISVEAGLGFDAAMAQVVSNVPGPLSQEIARMLHELQLGVSRADAFRMLADRTDVDELKAFVVSMIQANRFGVGVANVLRAQSKELRQKRRQRAERKAMQTPVKILFPLIFCVLPALFVVVMGPGAIRIFQAFFGTP
ncbi:MAG TPA: type II secretion system F family protein [Actinomycetota bacterium]|nr:type II secretion system F family protein [Actinomycetota bacterium]